MLLEENLPVDPRVCESAVGGIFSIRSAQVRPNPVRCFPPKRIAKSKALSSV